MSYRETEHLRVLIANERKDRLALVAPIVAALGHEVIAREIEVEDVGPVTARERPDVALVGLGESSEHALSLIEKIVHEAACPVIVLIHAPDPAFVREASRRGVFAHITDGDPNDWQNSIDIVLRRFAEYHDLEGAFGRRAVTERAKGILMERHSVDEAAAFRLLREQRAPATASSWTSPTRSSTATVCCRAPLQKPNQRSSHRSHDDHDDQRGAEPDRDDRRAEADESSRRARSRLCRRPDCVTTSAARSDGASSSKAEVNLRRELPAAEQHRPGGLEGDRERADEQDDDPGLRSSLPEPREADARWRRSRARRACERDKGQRDYATCERGGDLAAGLDDS